MPRKNGVPNRRVDDILDKVPQGLIRWGIASLVMIVLMMAWGTFLFKYPDVITSSATIFSDTPPVHIVSRTNGYIDFLPVSNNQIVNKGQILGIIQNTARFDHVFDLKDKLDMLSSGFEKREFVDLFSTEYSVGPIQSSLSLFKKQLVDFNNFQSSDLMANSINALKQRTLDLESYFEYLKAQLQVASKSLEISERQHRRDSVLYVNRVVSDADFEKSEQQLLEASSKHRNVLGLLENNRLEYHQLNFRTKELTLQNQDKYLSLLSELNQSFENLKTAIAEWERDFVLVSPMDGRLTYMGLLNKNQHILAGEEVFAVLPINPNKIVAKVKVPISGSGKIEVGQTAYIRLNNFPYTEFGQLSGRVESISLLPTKEDKNLFYIVDVSLPKGLITSYNYSLTFNQQMEGSALIVTKEYSLFRRLLNPMSSLVKN